MKRKLSYVLSVILLFTLVVPLSSVQAYTGGLANGKIAIISSSESGPEINRTSLITDNNENTSFLLKAGQYVEIDLERDYSISAFQIKADDSGSNGMYLSFHDSNKTLIWTRIGTHAGWAYPNGADGTFKTITDRNETIHNVRYVKFVSTKDVNISELDVFDTFTPPSEPNPEPEPEPQPNGDRAILVVTMTTGLEKEYDLPMSDVNEFLSWYDLRDVGSGPAKFALNKYNNNKGPFSKRTDYVIFDKILQFEVNEYSL